MQPRHLLLLLSLVSAFALQDPKPSEKPAAPAERVVVDDINSGSLLPRKSSHCGKLLENTAGGAMLAPAVGTADRVFVNINIS